MNAFIFSSLLAVALGGPLQSHVNKGVPVGPLTPIFGDAVQTPKGLRSLSLEGFSEDLDQNGFVDPIGQAVVAVAAPQVYTHVVAAAPAVTYTQHPVAAPQVYTQHAAVVAPQVYTQHAAVVAPQVYTQHAAVVAPQVYTQHAAVVAPQVYTQHAVAAPQVYTQHAFAAPVLPQFASAPVVQYAASPVHHGVIPAATQPLVRVQAPYYFNPQFVGYPFTQGVAPVVAAVPESETAMMEEGVVEA